MKAFVRIMAVGGVSACLAAVAAIPARASCASPANPIEAENCLTGTPNSVWEPPASDSSIEGFATQASVNPGSTISFKFHTVAASSTLSIYRMGYYGGNGARLVTTINVNQAQNQPACLSDVATGLVDCGNWAVSASWNVPSTAVSGLYFVELKRSDTGGGNIFSFVVRNDASHSGIVYQAQDTTQQAYNNYGGNSLYVGNPAGRAYKVSFNRPPASQGSLWDMFSFETAMIRWLERNAYDITYISGVDTDRNGALLLNHKVFMSVGHDEYWSGTQRANVEAARDAGVNLALFSGNTMYWKTRWENSIDGSNTDHRTLVCYKESTAGRVIDPQDPPTWTGLWMDGQFSPPGDGGRPENAVTGASGNVWGPQNRNDPMTVRAEDGKLRFWRNTALASLSPGSTMTFPQMLGYEWDEYVDNGLNPAGVIQLSSTALNVAAHVGTNTQGNYTAGVAIHRLNLYRAASGALVFGAGTMQWGWLLDNHHDSDGGPPAADPNIQQATVNLFADMGVQPATLQSGLVPASQSSDTTPPMSSVLTAPRTFTAGVLATVTGTAADAGGGVVGGVEISTNNGVSWRPAEGRSSWTYSWTPASTAFVTAMSRATDDSGNVEGRSGANNPVPALASLAPSSATVGSAGFVLSATGSNFINGSIVLWNGASRTTTFVNSTQLSAAIPASDLAAATTANVTVFNPGPGGGTSTGKAFVVGDPIPAVASLSPSSATAGAPGFNMTLIGTNFVAGSSVIWNGSNRTTVFVSSTQLTAAILTSDLAVSTSAQVAVFNPAPGGGTSAAIAFLVINPLPAITFLAPSSATVGDPGFSMGVIGSHFLSSSTVLWNGQTRATVYVSSSQLNASILTSDLSSLATAQVTVFNPGPGGGTSAAAGFLVGPAPNPVPALSAVTPSSSPAGSPGFSLGLTGSNFVSSSTVRWNGASRATVFISSTQLSASVLASDLALGTTANVIVFNPGPGGGASTAAAFFVDNPAPSLTALGLSSAAAGSLGFNLGVTGSNFVSSSTVLWNGSSRATVFVSSTQLTASILTGDLAAPTTASVFVRNPGPGGGISTSAAFVVFPPPSPAIFGLAPSSATADGPAFSLGLTGANFTSSSTVLWNGSSRATVFLSSTQLSASILAADLAGSTAASVAVFNAFGGGGLSTAAAFSIIAPVPALTSLAPAAAVAGGPGFNLGVTGSNFTNGSIVLWNGSNRATVFVSSTQLTASILAGDLAAPSLAHVAVFNPGPGGGTSAAAVFSVNAGGPPPPPQTLFVEPFNYPNGLITNEFAHFQPTSTSAVISSTWDMTSGSLFADGGAGWTGVPDDADPNAGSTNGNDSSVFHLTSKRTNFGDVSVSMSLNQSGFVTTPSTPSSAWDGVSVVLRFTSATSYYYVSAARRDNTVVIKKVSGATETTLASGAHAAALGAPQQIEADVHNSTGGAVTLRLAINGAQLLSFVDAGTGGAPLISSGAVGVFGDNANFHFGAFTVAPYSTGAAQNPVPSLTALSPSSATAGSPGFTLALTGANFISSSTVLWNGSSRATVFVSSTQLLAGIATADLAASTAAGVTVVNPGPGGGASTARTFLVYLPNPVPTLSSISPSSATAGAPGLTLSVFGANFVSSSTVLWNGSSRATVIVSSGQLNAQLTTADLAASTTAAVTVFSPSPGGGASAPQTFVVNPAVPGIPTLASISPSSAAAGALGFTLNAFGGGFVSSSTVLWNGTSRATVFVSSGQLSVQISTADLAAAATTAVTVFTPAPGGGTSATQTFLVYVPNPVPTLSSIAPSSATAGTPGLTLNVFGAGFVSSSTVRWNGASRATVFVSSSQLNTQILTADLASSTTAAVTVFSPGPGGGTSAAQAFIVTPPPPGDPTLASISPSSAAAGGLGFTLNAFGGGFVSSSTVLWNGASRATVFVSSGQLSVQISTADLAAAATAAVTVFTPAPGGGSSAARTFLVYSTNPIPTLSSISPSSATAGTPGLTLNVFGAGFVSSSTVLWNGASRVTVFVSSGQLNAQLTTADLAVSTAAAVTIFSPGPGGGTSAAQAFIVTTPPPGVPTLASISPSSAAAGGLGFTLNAFGGGFVSSSTVLWNGTSRATVFVSSGQLSVQISTADLAAAATTAVTVFTPAPGGGSSAAQTFLVYSTNPIPTLSSISPSSATAGTPGLTLNVFGAGYVSSSTVRWNGASRATVFVSSSQLNTQILTADLVSSTTAAVTVFSPGPGGGTSTAQAFIVTPPPPGVPTLASISPSSAAAGGLGFTLNAFGGGFVSSSTVLWNGTNRATVFVSSGQLSVQISTADLAAAATAAVTVFTPAPGGGASASQTFLVYATNPLPSLATISPSSATAGAAGFSLNLTGSGFISSSTVLWNGSGRATVFVSSTQLSAAILTNDLASPTTAQVAVFNPGPGGGTSTASGFVVYPSSSTPPPALFVESFNYPNGLITNEFAHFQPTGAGAVVSSTWDMLSGSLFADGGAGWTGVPDDVNPNGGSTNGTDSSVFQLTTKRNNFGDVSVLMALNQTSFVTTPSSPSAAWDGVSVALRFASSNSYYYISVTRRDNTVVIKKVTASGETTLASAPYTVVLGQSLQVQADVHNQTSTSVALRLVVNGTPLLSVVDSGTGGAALTSPGAVGVFADNANFHFGSFTVAAFGTMGVAALQPGPTASPLDADLSGVRIFPNPWRSDRHQGVPIKIDHASANSELRIFTLSGRWIRTISIPGGTGAWDLNNDAGQKAASGVYMYLITDGAGHRSRGTLAVIQ